MDSVLSSFISEKYRGTYRNGNGKREREKSRFNIGQSARINEMIAKRNHHKTYNEEKK
jgi:hypothetical protein